MHNRRAGRILAVSILLAMTAAAVLAPQETAASGVIAVDVADLKEQLESGLQARRPAEFQFIATVVAMVDNNQLPLRLVKETFHWVRTKRFRYKFPYFERGLRIRAARVGIAIP